MPKYHQSAAVIVAPKWFMVLVFLSLILASSRPVQAVEPSAGELVSNFHAVLLQTMKTAGKIGVKERYQKLQPTVSETFHLRVMMQVASGSHWRKASDEERDALENAFAQLTIATYATQFDGFSGQTFETLGTRDGPQKTTLVETRLQSPGGRSVDLVYVTRVFKGKWRVVDVLLDTGISELARKRSEYRQLLKSRGVSGLVNSLGLKTKSLLGED